MNYEQKIVCIEYLYDNDKLDMMCQLFIELYDSSDVAHKQDLLQRSYAKLYCSDLCEALQSKFNK